MSRRMPAQRPHRSKQDYKTPADFMEAARRHLQINAFAFDFAADATNHQAAQWWSETQDALKQTPETWLAAAAGGWGWLNPPFKDIAPWAQRCSQLQQLGGRVAFLVPAGVGANWFTRYVHGKALVLLLNGRLAFIEGHPDELYPKDCVLALYAPDVAAGYKPWRWRRALLRTAA